jgi:hypothetical protein
VKGSNNTRSATEVIAAAVDLVAAVAGQDVIPVVILDDADCWSRASGVNGTALAEAFFGRVIRLFADFPGALVLAIDEDYLSMPEFQETESFLERRIAIPGFDGQGSAQGDLGDTFRPPVRLDRPRTIGDPQVRRDRGRAGEHGFAAGPGHERHSERGFAQSVAAPLSEEASRAFKRRIAFVWSWDTRDSVTPSTSPISRRVSSS